MPCDKIMDRISKYSVSSHFDQVMDVLYVHICQISEIKFCSFVNFSKSFIILQSKIRGYNHNMSWKNIAIFLYLSYHYEGRLRVLTCIPSSVSNICLAPSPPSLHESFQLSNNDGYKIAEKARKIPSSLKEI